MMADEMIMSKTNQMTNKDQTNQQVEQKGWVAGKGRLSFIIE